MKSLERFDSRHRDPIQYRMLCSDVAADYNIDAYSGLDEGGLMYDPSAGAINPDVTSGGSLAVQSGTFSLAPLDSGTTTPAPVNTSTNVASSILASLGSLSTLGINAYNSSQKGTLINPSTGLPVAAPMSSSSILIFGALAVAAVFLFTKLK